MIISNYSWVWKYESLDIIAQPQDFEALSKVHRGSQPVGIITPLKYLSGYTVINLLAPKNFVFWALHDFHSIFDIQEHLLPLMGNIEARKALKGDMRAAKITQNSPNIQLLDMIVGILDLKGKQIVCYSSDKTTRPERFRLISLAAKNSDVAKIISFYEEALLQFGESAFFGVDERVVMVNRFSHWSDESRGAKLFCRVHNYSKFGEKYIEDNKKRTLIQLKFMVESLEANFLFDALVEAIYVVKPPLSLYLNHSIKLSDESKSNDVFGDEWVDLVLRDILAYRARLVRLLGWPIFYRDVKLALSDEHTGGAVRNYNITEPYNLTEELEAYMAEMLKKYPILETSIFE